MGNKKRTICLLLACIMSFSCFAAQKGSFIVRVETPNGLKKLVCYVPDDYSEDKSWPLIIALQPGGNTPAESMHGMMVYAAYACGAILICPDDQPQYDGRTIRPAIDYALENYNIEPGNIVITGYSAGGNHTFIYAMDNPDMVKGIIGIAPSIKVDLDYEKLSALPVCIIVGSEDPLITAATEISSALEKLGSPLKFLVKPGVGHYSSDYFYGPEFTKDWIECWEYIQLENKVCISFPENS